MLSKDDIASEFKAIQSEICLGLEAIDQKGKFSSDNWIRPEGGGGITRVMDSGNIIEKGGVNFSAVYGVVPEFLKKENQNEQRNFFATGVSIVLHPENPFVPIIHMNIRYFEFSDGECWFGGGIDLTPHYVRFDQASLFHQSLKGICDKHHSTYYSEFKKWADNYFFIEHRNETRGVGGIFFDHLKPNEAMTKEQLFNFVCELGRSFVELYTTQVELNKNNDYSEAQKKWQLLRRGRYVEFNLVYDRGTKFGLQTNGRIESILMSLPKLASWEYDFQPEKNSLEEKTLQFLRKDINWLV